jgi:hypothetical protein
MTAYTVATGIALTHTALIYGTYGLWYVIVHTCATYF